LLVVIWKWDQEKGRETAVEEWACLLSNLPRENFWKRKRNLQDMSHGSSETLIHTVIEESGLVTSRGGGELGQTVATLCEDGLSTGLGAFSSTRHGSTSQTWMAGIT
jgi:hypothetical protein